MSAMSQIMDATYCMGGDMDFGRMFDQYLHKGGDSFDLALSVPDTSPHQAYMADQTSYSSYGSDDGGYGDMQGLATPLPPQDGDPPPPPPPTHHPHHPQPPIYQHQMSMGVAANPQFPPQNLYIPPISQNNMGVPQTSGYMVPPQCGGVPPIYTSPVPPQGPPHHMMGGLMHYYPRHAPPHLPRTGGSPNSGGSPSPQSDDSDDSTPHAQMGRGKRPSDNVEGPRAQGKKPKVSKKSKKKKDPNEPQKPVSAYALFFRDTQAAIKGSSPNASFGEVSKIVASMWDSLDADHKNVYKKKTEAAKKEYLKALAAYRASLVSKGGEGEGVFGGPGGYPQFTPGFGYPPTTSAPPPGQPTAQQMSPLAKKSPLLSSLMADPPPPIMNPPMSQPMPPSGPPMMPPHGSMPPMSSPVMGPQPPPGSQGPHQPGTPQPHLAPMAPTSPYITQQAPGPMTSPGGAGSPGGGTQQAPLPQHSPQHQHHHQQQQQQVATQQQQQQAGQQQQQQQGGQTHQQQGGGQTQQGNGGGQQQQQQQPQQGAAQQAQQTPQQQGGGAQQSGGGGSQGGMGQPHMGCPTPGPNCIRSGCNNPAVHNPEWEDEYCSNECVVSHCRDVFSNWVASNHHQPMNPTYPAPVK